jgi:hypothetical protein
MAMLVHSLAVLFLYVLAPFGILLALGVAGFCYTMRLYFWMKGAPRYSQLTGYTVWQSPSGSAVKLADVAPRPELPCGSLVLSEVRVRPANRASEEPRAALPSPDKPVRLRQLESNPSARETLAAPH